MVRLGRFWPVFAAPLILPLLMATRPNEDVVEKAFVIEDASELNLRGSSNVNTFTCLCLCYEKNRSHSLQLRSNPGSRTVEFDRTGLRLTTHDLDCGHKGINTDLYRTLKADKYPSITIELLRAQETGASLTETKGWVNVKAMTAITIAGVRREVPMEIRAQHMGSSQFRFVGSRDILMSDFRLDPPKPMMGLIKVRDNITINLDLTIRVVDVS